MVKLQVSRKDDIAVRSLERNTHRVGNGVRNGEELHPCVGDGERLSRLHENYVRFWHIRILFLSALNHNGSQISRVDRRIAEARHKEGDAADMVKMGMRDDDRTNALAIFFKIRCVRERVIGARYVVFFFEMEARVHHDNVAVYVTGNHVATDLFNAAQWDDTHDIFGRRFGEIIRFPRRAARQRSRAAQDALDAARSAGRARTATYRATATFKASWRA